MTQEVLSKYYNQESERLRYRRLSMDDLDDWKVFFDDNEREHFLALDATLSPEEKAKEWIELQLERYAQGDFGHLAILEKSSGNLVGVSGLLVRNKESNLDYEVAYSILPNYWGKGYATEAAKNMKQFAMNHQLHHRVVSWIHPENSFSQNVAQKNGMKFNGEEFEFRGILVQVWEIAIL
ncbi:MAG: GNAT family N-acetyltransferase [Crocinitomicaceae bacterium]